MRTARARTSAENLFAFVIAQSSQRNEPLQNPGRFIELYKSAVQRGVKEGFFHARVGQGEPLLKEVRAQHGLQRDGGRQFLPSR